MIELSRHHLKQRLDAIQGRLIQTPAVSSNLFQTRTKMTVRKEAHCELLNRSMAEEGLKIISATRPGGDVETREH